jgi:hypothetical protein
VRQQRGTPPGGLGALSLTELEKRFFRLESIVSVRIQRFLRRQSHQRRNRESLDSHHYWDGLIKRIKGGICRGGLISL